MAKARGSVMPFGLGATKPRHYREMVQIALKNRKKAGYAWRILTRGVCDGCALGTTGLRDWTLDGVHLCLVRLNLLELNTMDAFDPSILEDVRALAGSNATELRARGRIPYPLRRRTGEPGFTRVGWDEAYQELGDRLRATDPQRAAMYLTSRGLTNEVYYAAQKAWRAYGSNHIDNAARLCHSPSTAAMKRVLGVAASTCSYRDWYGSDVVVFFGSNPANDQPVALKYLYDAKKRGTKVLVVNTYQEPGMRRYWIPSNPDSALFGTKIADGFFHVASGGDLAFVYAVQKLLVEQGRVDGDFIAAHSEGWESYVAHLERYSFEELVARSGASRSAIEGFAEILSAANTGVFVWSMGLTQHQHGADTIAGLCCLAVSQGWVGRERCGLMPIRGHSGVQGGAEMGAYATAFPGGRPVDQAEAERLAKLWGFAPPSEEGLDAVAMLLAAERGEIDFLYAMGGNFVDTLPQPERIEAALRRVAVRVHQDLVLTPKMLLDPQDVVFLLPAKTRYEHEGGVTETTTERRVVFSPHIPGHDVGEAREEWRIPVELVTRAKPEVAAWLDFPDAQAIRADIAHTIPTYRGIEQLTQAGDQFQWGGARLCEGGRFGFPSGRARFVVSVPPDRRVQGQEFRLTTRRGKQFNSMVQSEHDDLTGADRDHVFMNPEDVRRLGLRAEQPIRVQSATGELRGRVFEAPLTPGDIQMHWPEANVLIEHGPIDPGGRVPAYTALVRVLPVG